MVDPKNVPNILTLFRLAASVFFSSLLVLALPFNINWLNYILAFFFVAISLTDFFDGFFARRFNVESSLGKALDHIADKFFVISCFLALTYLHKLLFISALILVLREVFVLSLRNISLTKGFSVDVSIWGKVKVAAHYCLITVAILNTNADFSWESNISVLQLILTLSSIGLSLYSGYLYFMSFKEKLDENYRRSY